MNKNITYIVYFSEGKLHDSHWTATQYIGMYLSKVAKILYIQPPSPKLKLLSILLTFNFPELGIRRESENLFVLSLLNIFPFSYCFSPLKKLNMFIDLIFLKKILKRLNFRNPILYVNSFQSNFFIKRLNRKVIVYGCNNDPLTFPNNKAKMSKILKKEDYLLEHADVVFCTSKNNYLRKKDRNANTVQIRLGVDYTLYDKVSNENSEPPEDIKEIKHPIIGFVGAIDKYKLDFKLLRKAAQIYADWSFVIIGKISKSVGGKISQDEMPTLSNIYYLGYKDRKSVPYYIKVFDVCMIPYIINDYTKNLTTMKFFEYMASGKPIIITGIPELKQYEGLVEVGINQDDFIHKINRSLRENTSEKVQMRKAIAKKFSWETRIEEMFDYIKETLQKRN